jgi:hypothetical protein
MMQQTARIRHFGLLSDIIRLPGTRYCILDILEQIPTTSKKQLKLDPDACSSRHRSLLIRFETNGTAPHPLEQNRLYHLYSYFINKEIDKVGMRVVSSLAFALFGSGGLVSVSAQSDLPNLAEVAISNGFTTLANAANASGLLVVLETLEGPFSKLKTSEGRL